MDACHDECLQNCFRTWSQVPRTIILGDQRVTNFGKLWVLTDQASADQNTGEIFVHYTVKFHIPAIKLPPALYGTLRRPPPDGSFVQRNGNLRTGPGSNNAQWTLYSLGSFYITVIVEWGSTVVDNLLIFTSPAFSLLSEYTAEAFNFVADASGRSIHTYLVNLIAGALYIQHSTTGTGGYEGADIYVSTAKDGAIVG
jgi:hypothetical protein